MEVCQDNCKLSFLQVARPRGISFANAKWPRVRTARVVCCMPVLLERSVRAWQRLYAGDSMLGARPVFEYKIHVVHVTILQIVQPAHVVHFYEQLFPKESMLSPVPVPGTCTCTGKPDSIRFTMRSVDGIRHFD